MRPLPLNPPRPTPDAGTYLTNVWLDWFNNYITLEKFAEHNGINVDQAKALIALADSVYHSPHPEA
jgi:hypothetical protein